MAEENNQENNIEIQEKQPKNVWKILTIILAIILIISIARPFFGGISEGTAKTSAESYINSLLQGRAVATISSVESKGDLYKLNVDLGGEVIESYMTKDGSLFFPSAMDMKAPLITGSTTQNVQEEIPKTKQPEVKLFVMSQCPYGVLAENAIKPVLDLLKDKIDFKLFFIANENNGVIQSLHGQPEVDEDMRQLCVIKNYPETYMDYVFCVNKNYQSPQWESCLNEIKMDVNKIKSCVEKEGKSLLSENLKEAESLGVGGSPTLIINGVTYMGQRTPEAYKQAICSAFNKEITECSEILSTDSTVSSGSC